MIKDDIRKRVGDGMDTLSWHDHWIGKVPLKRRFPILFSLAINKQAKVRKLCFWDGKDLNWVFQWRRGFFDWELRVKRGTR